MKICVIKYLVVVSLFFTSCKEKDSIYIQDGYEISKYLMIHRTRFKIDTITRFLVKNEFIDSTYYKISYFEDINGDSVMLDFELPINGRNLSSKNLTNPNNYQLQLIGKKTIQYESSEYNVYKYLLDDTSAEDEELILFFVPQFGVVINKAVWWGNYDKLIEYGDEKNRNTLLFINEMILFDSVFFHKSN